jgi:phytoene desaturase
MNGKRVILIGGGLAGMSAGCYALRSGFQTTIVEHSLSLGGVCTSWQRGAYTIDGCIHWLTGGAFQRVYEELDILPAVELHTLETWATYRDAGDGLEIPFTRDLDALVAQLTQLAPEDAAELARVVQGARELLSMHPPFDAPELGHLSDQLRMLWEMRGAVGSLVHFRKPIGVWANEHLKNPRLRRIFTKMLPPGVPTAFLLMVLGYLEQGYLSRPVGGTAAFRDALAHSYASLGGEVRLDATVEEILVTNGRANGVRLADGTVMAADVVISTSSAPETVLQLLGGAYDPQPTRERMAKWQLIEPIVLASFGVAAKYAHAPSLMLLDGIVPFDVGGRKIESFTVRVCNDDPCFAPAGHTVVQALLPTDYEWWATRGVNYQAEKAAVADAVLTALSAHFPKLRAQVRQTDVATPLTYWNTARSWRGAFEGWMPSAGGTFGRVNKKLAGLEGFYMAGQWVEPGGGVPTAVLSGRQVIQLLCHDEKQSFVATGSAAAPALITGAHA